MDEHDRKWQRYQVAVNLAQTEEATVWQRFSIFLFANFLLLSATLWQEVGTARTALPVVGLALGLFWLAIAMRGFTFQVYYFRYAKELEAQLDPHDLIRKASELGEQGKRITVAGSSMRLPWLGRLIMGRHAAYVIISIFMAIYLTLIVFNLRRFMG